ncbi:hypothetical protein AMK59_7983 [Oryctes borbonicus]|uniref:Dihydroorotate dehydrogenase (quinone), mitochondrial n=1 Tax=Oryctes borbonicus TaxID=1629725 RepID=A0A0T6AUM4_9SCAR|nr:hypothetical protein AMK59_7983 [Oryctes borbonicus]
MYYRLLQQKIRSLILVTIGGIGVYSSASIYKEKQTFFKDYVVPLIHLLDPEKAHRLAIFVGKYRLLPKSSYSDPNILKTKLFNTEFPNPVGIAAGFDKHGEAILGLRDMGFGFVEVGSITPNPQLGNAKPRVFRLSSDEAVINRYGFNSEGHEAVLNRLENVRSKENINLVLGVNLGKNKESADEVADYVNGIKKFGSVADYLVINISSPNTPGLRDMQTKFRLRELLKNTIKARNELSVIKRPPLLLKLAPDLNAQERKDIANVLLENDCKVDGLIICNTTVTRPESLQSKEKSEIGGLSGKPLKDMSTEMIAEMYQLTEGIPIIGVGGISSGQDAYDKIKAGASAVQLYTSFIYEGPPVVEKIKKELAELLELDNYSNISEAVGKNVRK